MIACMNDRHCEEARSADEATSKLNAKPYPLYAKHPIRHARWLVTGGAGFIGSHIVERLLKEGHFVRVLDNFSSGKEENLDFAIGSYAESRKPKAESFELIRGNIRDYSTCVSACHGVDYVLHQAALRSVPKSMEAPHDYNAVNIDGSLNILEAALKTKVKRVVLASSSSVYGETTKFPEKETDMPLLISPYALSKLAAEYYSRIFSENYGLETVNLRYFNVFGPRQSLDDEYAVVIPKFITCMLNDEQPPIYGNGMQSRDFTYVDNVVEANLLAAITPAESRKLKAESQSNVFHDVFNVGTGEANTTPSLRGHEVPEAISINNKLERSEAEPPHRGQTTNYKQQASNTFCGIFNVACGKNNSILDLVDTLNQIMDKNIKPLFLDPRPGDVFKTHADISKIKSKLGYEPTVDFEEGLKITTEWFEKQQLVLAMEQL